MRLASDVADCKFIDAVLELQSRSDRFDGARKLRQEPVPGIFNDATAVFRNRGIDSARKERCQFGMSSLFVIVH